MTGEEVVYRCDSCTAEFRVVSEQKPQVICPDCKVVATPSGDERALRAYHIGYARYQEARRQLGAGLKRYAADELVDARALFDSGGGDFEIAVKQFKKGADRADTPTLTDRIERARKKANCFWQGADWLSSATYAQENATEKQALQFRKEAEQMLEQGKDLGDLDDPETLASHTEASITEKEKPAQEISSLS